MGKIYVKDKTIEQCYHNCPFFTVNGNCMECDHPYFEDKDPYERLIITQSNSRDNVPDKCPLRTEEFVMKIKYSLKE